MCWREGGGILHFNRLSSAGLHSQNVLVTSDLFFKGQVTGLLLLQEAVPPSPPSGWTDHTYMPPAPLLAHRPYWLTGILARAPLRSAAPSTGPCPEQVLTS